MRKPRMVVLVAVTVACVAASSLGQVTPAAGVTPPDDTPKFNIGATIFGDSTYQQSPKVQDADRNNVNLTSFNIARAYINVTGNLNHRIAFRITPDIARESGSGSSLSGSQTYRLKYAYGQFNLDDWTTRGTWLRLGMQQTPWIDYAENLWRYRFQGTVFLDRELFLSSSDVGFSGHYNFPGNYGDVHAGFYNGETYSRPEVNNQKAFQVRGTVRPMPLGGVWKGLRVTGFYDGDSYFKGAKRQRALAQISFEHPLFTVAYEHFKGKDRSTVTSGTIDSKGYSAWATAKLGANGWEAILRHDELQPNESISGQKRKRNIAGIAYWFQGLQRVTSALLLDYDSLERTGLTPSVPRTTNYALKMLINF